MIYAYLAVLYLPGFYLCWHLMTMPVPGVVTTSFAPELVELDAPITLDSDVRGLV